MKKKTNKKKVIKARVVKGNKLITIASPVSPDLQIVIASELADDSIIESEMMGEIAPFWVYQFDQKGTKISGLTVKGVNETVRRLNKNPKSGSKIHTNPNYLRIERDVEQDGEKGIEVWVFAEDLVSGNSGWGAKFEPYFKAGKNGRYKNEFALEKALAKAERNAKKKLINEALATKIIQAMIKEGGHVKQIQAPSKQIVAINAPAHRAPTENELDKKIRHWISTEKDIGRMAEWIQKMKATKKNNAKIYEDLIKQRVKELEK